MVEEWIIYILSLFTGILLYAISLHFTYRFNHRIIRLFLVLYILLYFFNFVYWYKIPPYIYLFYLLLRWLYLKVTKPKKTKD